MSSDPYVSPDQPPRATPATPGAAPHTSSQPDVPGSKPVPGTKPGATVPPTSAVKFTRTAAAWWAIGVGALILIILLIFIAQNTDSVGIHFLGWQWDSPVGVALLLSAVGGALITLAAGTARMVQLRRAAKKNLRAR